MTLHICDACLRCGLWYYCDLIVDLQRFQQRIIGCTQRIAAQASSSATTTTSTTTAAGLCTILLAVHRLAGHRAVRRVHMRLKLFIHAKGCCAHGAFVG